MPYSGGATWSDWPCPSLGACACSARCRLHPGRRRRSLPAAVRRQGRGQLRKVRGRSRVAAATASFCWQTCPSTCRRRARFSKRCGTGDGGREQREPAQGAHRAQALQS